MANENSPSHDLIRSFSLWAGYLTFCSGLLIALLSPFVIWAFDSKVVDGLVSIENDLYETRLRFAQPTPDSKKRIDAEHASRVDTINSSFWPMWMTQTYVALVQCGVVICVGSITMQVFADGEKNL